jgi:hypothetical protein
VTSRKPLSVTDFELESVGGALHAAVANGRVRSVEIKISERICLLQLSPYQRAHCLNA